MKKNRELKMTVVSPGSSGNLGCGFDALGAALEIKNSFIFKVRAGQKPGVKIKVSGCGKGVLPEDKRNAVWQSAVAIFHKVHFDYKNLLGVEIEAKNNIPLMRGLGSSASARVAGAVFANEISGGILEKKELLKIVARLEGHYDNAAASLFGGITVTVPLLEGKERGIQVVLIKKGLKSCLVFAVPEFTVSTWKARKMLPKKYSAPDAIFNISRAAALVDGLYKGALRPYMFEDRIHTPYRKKLIKGFESVRKKALEAGSLGVFISGSGSSVGAFASSRKNALKIGRAMKKAFASAGVKSEILITRISEKGARVV